MTEIFKITDPYVIAQANTIRNRETLPGELRKAIYRVGGELGKKVVEKFCLKQETLKTPMNHEMTCIVPDIPASAIITTRDDMQYFGMGVTEVLGNCTRGFMDFRGHRGLQALNSSVRDIEFPDMKHNAVNLLIIGKSVLATGCTAVSLTKAALYHFLPEKLIIISIFYSNAGIAELKSSFPNAHIFVVGDPDLLTEDGLLVPGIGLLE